MTVNRITTPRRSENRTAQRVDRDATDRYRKCMVPDGAIQPNVRVPVHTVETFHFENTEQTTVTDFLNGYEGQEIHVVMDGNTVLAETGNIVLRSNTLTPTGNQTIPVTTRFVIVETAGLTLTLPQPALFFGPVLTVKNMTTGAVTLAPNGSESIDGSTSNIMLTVQYESVTLFTNKVNWFIE